MKPHGSLKHYVAILIRNVVSRGTSVHAFAKKYRIPYTSLLNAQNGKFLPSEETYRKIAVADERLLRYVVFKDGLIQELSSEGRDAMAEEVAVARGAGKPDTRGFMRDLKAKAKAAAPGWMAAAQSQTVHVVGAFTGSSLLRMSFKNRRELVVGLETAARMVEASPDDRGGQVLLLRS